MSRSQKSEKFRGHIQENHEIQQPPQTPLPVQTAIQHGGLKHKSKEMVINITNQFANLMGFIKLTWILPAMFDPDLH